MQAKFDLQQKLLTARTLQLAEDVGMDFQFCPAGKFKMGYVDAPEIAPIRDVTITRPFWISKGLVTEMHLGAVHGEVNKASGNAVRVDTRQQADEYVALFQKKYGSLLPKGYVFRLPTEAEWEYVAKSGAKEAKGELFSWRHDYRKNPLKNAWGVAGLCESTMVAFFDKIPMSDGKGAVKADIAHHDNILTGIDYSKASDKDPCAWSGDAQARTLRRIVTSGRGDNQKLSSLCEPSDNVWVFFHLVIAPDPATLNKFEIK